MKTLFLLVSLTQSLQDGRRSRSDLVSGCDGCGSSRAEPLVVEQAKTAATAEEEEEEEEEEDDTDDGGCEAEAEGRAEEAEEEEEEAEVEVEEEAAGVEEDADSLVFLLADCNDTFAAVTLERMTTTHRSD